MRSGKARSNSRVKASGSEGGVVEGVFILELEKRFGFTAEVGVGRADKV